MASDSARAAYNARLLAELKADPASPRHASATAYRAGCRCRPCCDWNTADTWARRHGYKHGVAVR